VYLNRKEMVNVDDGGEGRGRGKAKEFSQGTTSVLYTW
jgi:hypothetical protein